MVLSEIKGKVKSLEIQGFTLGVFLSTCLGDLAMETWWVC